MKCLLQCACVHVGSEPQTIVLYGDASLVLSVSDILIRAHLQCAESSMHMHMLNSLFDCLYCDKLGDFVHCDVVQTAGIMV